LTWNHDRRLTSNTLVLARDEVTQYESLFCQYMTAENLINLIMNVVCLSAFR